MLEIPEEVSRLAVALGCGLLIGLERERRKSQSDHSLPAGVRTFSLIALTGAVAQHLGPVMTGVAAGFVGLAALASHLRGNGSAVQAIVAAESRLLVPPDGSTPPAGSSGPGLTTEVAMLLTFLLGVLAMVEPVLTCGLGVVVAIILASKSKMHDFVHRTLSDEEVRDGLVLAAAAAIVLPLLPAEPVDPWGVLNLRKLWLLVVMVMAINAVGYIALRALGARVGLAVTGLTGGFVSSTATIASMAQRSKQTPDSLAACVSAALMSNIGTILQLALILAAVAPALLRSLAAALAISGVAITAVAVLASWRSFRGNGAGDDDRSLRGRPFEFRQALFFAAIVGVVMVLSALLNRWLGTTGVFVAAGVAGLTDAHAPAASVAQLQAAGALALAPAELAILLGLSSNTLTKTVVASTAGGAAFAWRLVPGLVLMLGSFAAGLWWF